MALEVHDIGDMVRISADFFNAQGELTDPSEVYFHLRTPDGNIDVKQYGVDNEVSTYATGRYRIDVVAEQEGMHYYAWRSVGSGQGGGESCFYVRPSLIN